MNNTELKPCPFCGGEGKFVTDANVHQNGELVIAFHIECRECRIKYPNRYVMQIALGSQGQIITKTDQRQEAVDEWNRRVSHE